MHNCLNHSRNSCPRCKTSTGFLFEGEYGQTDIAIGVPVVLGENGVEKIVELDFTDAEQQAFNTSAQVIKKLIEEI